MRYGRKCQIFDTFRFKAAPHKNYIFIHRISIKVRYTQIYSKISNENVSAEKPEENLSTENLILLNILRNMFLRPFRPPK